MGKQRLEFDDGRTTKFWEISLSGTEHTVRFGRIGTQGQIRTKSFATAKAAENDAFKRIAEKHKKGYIQVFDESESPARHKIPTSIKYRSNATLGTDSVSDAWSRIEAWLEEHLPVSKKGLQRPAKVREIKAVEEAIGLRLPEDFKESYRRHDGQDEMIGDGIIFGLPLATLELAKGLWESNARYEKSKKRKHNFDDQATCFPVDYVQPVYASRSWLPISHDGSGNTIAIDLDPGDLGVAGQVIVCDRNGFHPVLALSWSQFLADIAAELERGNWRLRGLGGAVEFSLGSPRNAHFHDVGADWSRRKLGLRKLDKENESIWKQRSFAR